jgi:thioredoxin-related protein
MQRSPSLRAKFMPWAQIGRACLFLLVSIFLLPMATADAQQSPFAGRTVLVMVDRADCHYCRKWDREVMAGYIASEEGRRAPLVKRQQGHRDLAAAGFGGIGFTPTFILLDRGVEVGRIIGYGGPDHFWGEMSRVMSQFNSGKSSGAPAFDPRRVATR